jgi:shikimate dehydrogenase
MDDMLSGDFRAGRRGLTIQLPMRYSSVVMTGRRRAGTMIFIGVSTSGSSIMQLFPRWADLLGLDAVIEGRDLPLFASPHAYREVVTEIKSNPSIRGALVTTHKTNVFRSCRDLFDDLDELAQLCREISCISRRDDSLVGQAKDPITAGAALDRIFDGRIQIEEALCLGSGGAGTAITVWMLQQPSPPARIVVVDRSEERIQSLREIHERMDVLRGVEYLVTSSSDENDELLARLKPGALIINATGMGKDTSGSPLTDAARFPDGATIWELNYRGELDFLRQAERSRSRRRLNVHDGWHYFLCGWAEHVAEVFGIEVDEATFERLAAAAEPFSPRT